MLWPPPGALRKIHPWTHSTLDKACFAVFHCFLRAISSDGFSTIHALNVACSSSSHFCPWKHFCYRFPFKPSSCNTWHCHITCTLHRFWSELRSGLGVKESTAQRANGIFKFPLFLHGFCAPNDQHIVLCFAKAAIRAQKRRKALNRSNKHPADFFTFTIRAEGLRPQVQNIAFLQHESQFSFDRSSHFHTHDSGIESVFFWLYSSMKNVLELSPPALNRSLQPLLLCLQSGLSLSFFYTSASPVSWSHFQLSAQCCRSLIATFLAGH